MSAPVPVSFASWSWPRKAAAAALVLAAYAGLACAALYLAGVLFVLLNKANPAQVRLGSIVHYWHLYAGDPRLNKKLHLAAGVSGGGLLLFVPLGLVAAARPRRALHGDARFASSAEVARAGLLGGNTPGIIVGRYHGRVLALGGQLSVMLSAPTRSGKGVGVVIPNLLNWPHSVVVLDVKGENFEITSGYRAAHGQAVYAFSPFDDAGRSHRWNPLSSVRADPFHRVGDLLGIGQVFYPNDGSGTSSEAFFNDQARNLFLGLGLLLLETPQLPRTIGEVLRQSSGKGRTLREHLVDAIRERSETSRPFSEECRDALQRLLSNSDNTLSSIVATLVAPLTIFADAIVDAATSADDFNLDDVRRRPMSVYLRVPPHRLASARPLITLFFSQLISLNTQRLPEQDRSLRYQCLIVNDEFTAMGRASVITNAAAFLSGYGLRLLTVVQAMSQLDAVYGEKESRTFATNHGLQILFAPREQRDAEEYSAMLGFLTERSVSNGRSRSFSGQSRTTSSQNESDQRRALLMPQEFKELGSDRQVIVLENCKPILAEKIRYYREAAFKARLIRAPSIERLKLELHLARIQQRWRYLDDELAPHVRLDTDTLAYDWSELPTTLGDSPELIAQALIRFLDDDGPDVADSGGSVEPMPDEDGVLLAGPEGSQPDSTRGVVEPLTS